MYSINRHLINKYGFLVQLVGQADLNMMLMGHGNTTGLMKIYFNYLIKSLM